VKARLTLLVSTLSLLLPAAAGAAPRPDVTNGQLLARLPGPAGTAVAFSRDGKLILTAGGDEARVWEAETYGSVTGPLRHDGQPRIFRATLSADGNAVITVAAGEARLWHSHEGRLLHTFRHTDKGAVTFAAFSPDCLTIVTTGSDNEARLWDARTRQRLHVLRHDAPVHFAAFDPAGSRLVTLSDSTVQTGDMTSEKQAGSNDARVWDVKTGRHLASHDADVGPLDQVTRRPAAFTADGGAVVSIYTWMAFLWDASSGRYIAQVDGRAEYLGWELGSASVFALSPDGERLAIAGHVSAGVWDIRHGLDARKPLAVLRVQTIDDIQFSPDGRRVLVATDTDDSGVWDLSSGRQLLSLRPTRGDAVPKTIKPPPPSLYDWKNWLQPSKTVTELPAVAFSPDGRRVAAGFASDGFTGIWEVPQPKGPPTPDGEAARK
jgi:WD40 repeat protein